MAKAFNQEVFESLPVPKAVAEFVVPAMLSTIITINSSYICFSLFSNFSTFSICMSFNCSLCA